MNACGQAQSRAYPQKGEVGTCSGTKKGSGAVRRGPSAKPVRRVRRGALLLARAVDDRLEAGAGGELRRLGRLDLHGLARLRVATGAGAALDDGELDRKSTRLNSSHE